MKRRTFAIPAAIIAVSLLAGCGSNRNPVTSYPTADQYDASIAIAWFDLAGELVQAERLSPPVASRFYGYAGVTLYEAVVSGLPNNQTLVGQINDLEIVPRAGSDEHHWPSVANAALATLMRGMFANASAATLQKINDLEALLNQEYVATTKSGVFDRSANFGKLVGLAIFNWALTDGYATYNNCAYTPPPGAGLWQPTPPAFAPALQPCWGEMRPFVLGSSGDCRPDPPPTFDETIGSPFYEEMMEVYNTVTNLTSEQLTIAQFWADDPGTTSTPPGHSLSILTQVLQNENSKLGFAAEAYARVGMATADAFISCWEAKYVYNLLRPITCIRDLVDAEWMCPVNTPPFPEYTSGHSVQSGATATVMTALFGDNYTFVDYTHNNLGYAPRQFSSFFEAAEEAAISRLYGGIHFRSAIDVGVEQGKCVGERVSTLQLRK